MNDVMKVLRPPCFKICGLKSLIHSRAAANAGATHLGFVFFPKSPRHVEVDEAVRVSRALPENIVRVALLVDPDDALMSKILGDFEPHAVQLHGSETPEEVARINHKAGPDIEVWKALGMAGAADVDIATQYDGVADRLLFDARPPKGAKRPGGHGGVFDWSILRSYQGETPWLLAGGLTPKNVGEAIAACAAIPGFAGVDVSSGVETAPGEKCVEKIEKFIYAAQEAYRGVD